MSGLLLPDYRDLLMVSSGDERSIKGMVTINQASADWLASRIDTGTYFDVLDHFGIDPFSHLNPVEDLVFNQVITLNL
ncbi:MAG: hypothetical protein RMY16_13280 [Nostoc sp. DedQUE12b]|uniref:hypothetical protein n=1 Tax=Nostoc sp. DedQUE12b TaxID=3075398 RepID=UPI002AD3B9C6|nr:hypothetical protein [Nostoc sp. DedQUE12b]MDZ8086511.1 hypothetical protein [Nostoc sp. DedQUE12b]